MSPLIPYNTKLVKRKKKKKCHVVCSPRRIGIKVCLMPNFVPLFYLVTNSPLTSHFISYFSDDVLTTSHNLFINKYHCTIPVIYSFFPRPNSCTSRLEQEFATCTIFTLAVELKNISSISNRLGSPIYYS